MVFFHFGDDSSSWAVGNDLYAFQCNLGGSVKAIWGELGALFSDKSMAGTRIQWLSTSPDGSYCLQERNGTIRTNRTDLIEAIRSVTQGASPRWNAYSVDHVSFSPYGAWFMRLQPNYGSGVVQLSSKGRFPDTFIVLASRYLDFSNHGLQPSSIQYAFFGAQDGVLIKLENGTTQWDRVGPKVADCLRNLGASSGGGGYYRSFLTSFSVGKNTALCPYNPDNFFVHAVPLMRGTAHDFYRYSVGCDGVTADFLDAIIKGGRPHPRTIPEPVPRDLVPDRTAEVKVHVEEKEGDDVWWAKEGKRGPDNDEIPQASRDIFERLFYTLVKETGNWYATGEQAAAVMRKAGLNDQLLSEIWERADVDKNGKLDRDEFIHAMWLVTQELSSLQDDGVVPRETLTDPGHANNALAAASNFTPLRRTDSMPASEPYHQPYHQPPESKNQTAKQDTSDLDRVDKQFGDMKLRESLMASIISEKPNIKWDDVAGLGPAKEELQEAIIFPLRFPQMFQGKRRARRAILLYGPPGTGKSYLAKAVATEVEHTLFSISSSDVMSKWFGDSEGLVRQLFELAREKKPAIIFIDEIDALCSSRDGGPGGGNEHTARMKTEFLVQMDGVGKDNSGVLVLAATNLPWSLDPAVRRRFQKRIHIPLPDAEARKQLFRIHLGDLGRDCTDKDIDELARRTEGFSGSDIANAIQDGLMVPVKKVQMATHFRKIRHAGSEYYTPCEGGDPGAIPMTWKKVPPNKLKEPSLTAEDLFVVMKHVKPSVAGDEIGKYHEWTEQFGLEGA
ncbi:EF-hand domain-containing protein [Madurella fahalii]|uniref:EF-hand domain-containing protein n=1 Tax=Madurella fahalii TaxID=1157608 RepID=A0ABQ0GLA1_9PEZI